MLTLKFGLSSKLIKHVIQKLYERLILKRKKLPTDFSGQNVALAINYRSEKSKIFYICECVMD